MTTDELVKQREITPWCTGCYFKYKPGLCPREFRETCTTEKIIWKLPRKTRGQVS